jgi:four helix bundle protein
MDNKEFGRELEIRTKAFAVGTIRLSATLPNTPEGKVVRSQLTRSATSIGANYREANRARSKADFRNKINICQSESSETQYWLEVARDMNWLPDGIAGPSLNECGELLALFTSIGSKLPP